MGSGPGQASAGDGTDSDKLDEPVAGVQGGASWTTDPATRTTGGSGARRLDVDDPAGSAEQLARMIFGTPLDARTPELVPRTSRGDHVLAAVANRAVGAEGRHAARPETGPRGVVQVDTCCDN